MESVAEQLEADDRMLDQAERGGGPRFRVWKTTEPTVVIGRSVDAREEVDEDFCRLNGIAVVGRSSGGRSVVVGPGTVQYTFALPYSLAAELSSIPGAKRFCNRLLIAALERATTGAPLVLLEDVSGDLTCAGRKVAGLALRRKRAAMMLHGTILVCADLELIARALKHPVCEPAYRTGRSHEQFLANLGALDDLAFAGAVGDRLLRLQAPAVSSA